LIRRMIGAAMLNAATFEEVEADGSATKQAMLVVVIVALATGVGTIATGGGTGLVLGVIIGLAGWAAWAGITYFIGTTLLRGADTQADWGELARTLGFAQSAGVLKVFAFIPFLGPIVFGIASLLQLFAMVVAIRQALDFTSTWRAIGVALVGFIPYAILMAILQNIFRTGSG